MFHLSVTLMKVGTPSAGVGDEWNGPNCEFTETVLRSCYSLGFVM